jgi:class 3 adenylate cyclase
LTDIVGAGSSDVLLDDEPALQWWVDGLLAVLDAVGSESASIFTMSGTAQPAIQLAASHPQRVRSLLLWSPYALYARTPDHPCGMPEPTVRHYIDRTRELMGTGAMVAQLAPSWSDDAAKRRWWARSERLCGGPRAFASALEFWVRIDVRPALESVQAPTLLMRRRGDRDALRGQAEVLADRIPNARYVEFDGDDNVWFAGDADPVLDEIESFVTGARSPKPTNRVLTTVLFTDIVGSTERATKLGDEAWAAGLAAHNRAVKREIDAARGKLVKFTGDGVLATFDGPARAIECGYAIRDAVDEIGLSIRVGLHTGEVEMGDDDVHGIAVHIAARIMGLADAGEVLVSGVMPPLVLGSRLSFTARGEHQLKGVPGNWSVFAVDDLRA